MTKTGACHFDGLTTAEEALTVCAGLDCLGVSSPCTPSVPCLGVSPYSQSCGAQNTQWTGCKSFEPDAAGTDCILLMPPPPPSPPNPPPDANSLCGQTFTGDTTGATNVIGNAAGDGLHEFTVTSVGQGVVSFSLCGGASWDTYLRIYEAPVESFAGGGARARALRPAEQRVASRGVPR
jgi:hypothetical protein